MAQLEDSFSRFFDVFEMRPPFRELLKTVGAGRATTEST
jgi:hypothetical protein